MGILKDFYQQHLFTRKRYWPKEIINLRNWWNTVAWRHQRAERGWSTRDVWGGGEYLSGVAGGILRVLDDEQNPVDWDQHFAMNYEDIKEYGYKSLTEVADDIELYLWWEQHQYDEPLYGELRPVDRQMIDIQLYSQLQNAMHFVAQNIGHLWW